MSEWRTMDSAPKDGSLCWLAIKPLYGGLLSRREMKKVRHEVVSARFDTWNMYWRQAQTGNALLAPGYLYPEFWQPCPVPTAPPAEN